MRSVRVAALLLSLTAGCGSGMHVPPLPGLDPCGVATSTLLEDVALATTVVGTGTPASCTGEGFVRAVEQDGGVITFDCGPDPVTLTVPRTAEVHNLVSRRLVVDGGGKVTLSGGGVRRILYMNTCLERLGWLTSRCDDQEWPQLTVQNIAFVDGNSSGDLADNGGGGAIFAQGGRFKAVNARFFRNRCDPTGPDVAGGAIRAFMQWRGLPARVVGSTFGGAEGANSCSNGAALGSIGVSWTVLDSVFTGNAAVGHGANPARSGTPGGGSGGAIYADGNTMTLALCRVRMTGNTANEGGGAVFFVSNDLTGHLVITDSTLRGNPSAGFETQGYPGIFYLGSGPPQITRSTLSATP